DRRGGTAWLAAFCCLGFCEDTEAERRGDRAPNRSEHLQGQGASGEAAGGTAEVRETERARPWEGQAGAAQHPRPTPHPPRSPLGAVAVGRAAVERQRLLQPGNAA